MTLEEKVGQMVQVTLDLLAYGEDSLSSYEPVVLDPAMLEKAFVKYQIGSVLNTANNRARDIFEWNRTIKLIQDAGFDATQEDIMQVQNELSDKELNRVVAAGKSSHCVIYIPCPCESRYHTGVAL